VNIDNQIAGPAFWPEEMEQIAQGTETACRRDKRIIPESNRKREPVGGYGDCGQDLDELWIESLIYYPEQMLIYPYIAS
jgi:hypothetical protein